MKKALIFLCVIICVSCTRSVESSFFYTMNQTVQKADSLYNVGKCIEADSLLEGVISQNYSLYHPGVVKRLFWRVFADSEYMQGFIYYECLFAYMIQLDAIELRCKHELDGKRKVQNLQQIFALPTCIDDAIEEYNSWQNNLGVIDRILERSFSVFNSCYQDYISVVEPPRCFTSTRSELSSYLYRRKWALMNSLLIEHDKEYGYEKTYALFDSALVHYGASLEPYTKALIKAYMSFSGNEKYRYDTNMTYEDFKSIIEYSDDWMVDYIMPRERTIFNSDRNSISIINANNSGVVVKYDDEVLSNPTTIAIKDWGSYDTGNEMVTINESQIDTIFFEPGQKYLVSITKIDVDKPTLIALLHKYNLKDVVKRLHEVKQYYMRDTLVREGFEDGFYKVIMYDKHLRPIDLKLFSPQKIATHDSVGMHWQTIEYRNDSTITSFYSTDLKCFETKIELPILGDSIVTITENDSIRRTRIYYLDNKPQKIIIEYKKNPTAHIAKEITYVSNAEMDHFGRAIMMTEYHRFNKDGSYFEDLENGSIVQVITSLVTNDTLEVYMYDKYKLLFGRWVYQYEDDYVVKSLYKSMGCVKTIKEKRK